MPTWSGLALVAAAVGQHGAWAPAAEPATRAWLVSDEERPRKTPATIPAREARLMSCMASMRPATWRWVTCASSWATTPASSDSCSNWWMRPVNTYT